MEVSFLFLSVSKWTTRAKISLVRAIISRPFTCAPILPSTIWSIAVNSSNRTLRRMLFSVKIILFFERFRSPATNFLRSWELSFHLVRLSAHPSEILHLFWSWRVNLFKMKGLLQTLRTNPGTIFFGNCSEARRRISFSRRGYPFAWGVGDSPLLLYDKISHHRKCSSTIPISASKLRCSSELWTPCLAGSQPPSLVQPVASHYSA